MEPAACFQLYLEFTQFVCHKLLEFWKTSSGQFNSGLFMTIKATQISIAWLLKPITKTYLVVYFVNLKSNLHCFVSTILVHFNSLTFGTNLREKYSYFEKVGLIIATSLLIQTFPNCAMCLQVTTSWLPAFPSFQVNSLSLYTSPMLYS